MLAGVALRAIYTTVFLMNDTLVNHIKLLPLPEDTEKTNRSWLASGGHRAISSLMETT